MKLERPQAAVPWLPSRRRYAAFRLVAYLRLARTRDCNPDPDRVLALDRDQSSAETFVMAFLVWATTASFLTHLFALRLVLPFAAVAGAALAVIGLNAFVVFVGVFITPVLHAIGLPRGPHNIGVASAVFLIVLAVAASYFATFATWVAVPAWIFLGAIAINAVAAGILFVLRSRVREAESRCVV